MSSWRGMFHDVQKYITNGKICQKNQFTGPYIKAAFQETDTQFHSWDKRYLDIVGPLPMSEDDHKYVLTCQDNLSKYVLAIPVMKQTSRRSSTEFYALYCITI